MGIDAALFQVAFPLRCFTFVARALLVAGPSPGLGASSKGEDQQCGDGRNAGQDGTNNHAEGDFCVVFSSPRRLLKKGKILWELFTPSLSTLKPPHPPFYLLVTLRAPAREVITVFAQCTFSRVGFGLLLGSTVISFF